MAVPPVTTAPSLVRAPIPKSATSTRLGTPRLSVAIINYRQWDQTDDLVRELSASACLRAGDTEVVIVDNHSPAHPLAKKLRRLPGVSLRRWQKNHGFARAVNEACRLSRGDWFLLLNPDMTLSEGFLDKLLDLADELEASNTRTGIVGFHLRHSDGSQQLSAGQFPTLTSTVLRLFLPRRRRKYLAPRRPRHCRVPWVTGCCMLIRRQCYEELDGFDENFFLYYEDVDFCLRAARRGWSVWYEPDLAIVHHHPLHSRAVPAVLRLVTRHSLLTYAAKHWPPWHAKLLGRIVRLESWLRRAWAWWRGDAKQSAMFRELTTMTGELLRGDADLARRRLDRAVQRVDVRVGV